MKRTNLFFLGILVLVCGTVSCSGDHECACTVVENGKEVRIDYSEAKNNACMDKSYKTDDQNYVECEHRKFRKGAGTLEGSRYLNN